MKGGKERGREGKREERKRKENEGKKEKRERKRREKRRKGKKEKEGMDMQLIKSSQFQKLNLAEKKSVFSTTVFHAAASKPKREKVP